MKYFHDCTTPDDATRRYRELAMKHHPDRGGNAETFQAVKQEFDEWNVLYKHGHFANTAGRSQKASAAKKRPSQKPATASKARKVTPSKARTEKGHSVAATRQKQEAVSTAAAEGRKARAWHTAPEPKPPFVHEIETARHYIAHGRQLISDVQDLFKAVSRLLQSDDE